MTPHPSRSPAALLLLVLLLMAAPLRAEDAATFERWYVVMLSGQRVGHLHRTETAANGRITTTESMQLAIRRGDVAVEIEQGTRFTETRDGEPVEASTLMRLAQQPTETKFTFADDGVTIERMAGGRTTTEHAPLPDGEFFTPAAARRYELAQAQAGAQTVTFSELDVSTGRPSVGELTVTRVGPEKVEVMGKTVPAEVWNTTQTGLPGVVLREHRDERGRMLRTTLAVGFLELEIVAADEAVALSPADPPELVASTLVQPKGELPNPRGTRRAVYRLTMPDTFEGDLPRAGYQRATWADDRTVLVVQNLDEPVNPDGDEPDESHLAATSMLDHEDESVRKLTTEALGDGGDAMTLPAKAERLRAFVRDYVATKNLSVGFATATEVAQTAEGDCTEHAVLLAAMLRAAGIPSRTVTGLIYVDQFIGQTNVFGYHMWAQAWLTPVGDAAAGARWVDLDATLDDPFDAAHIALASSAMDEGEFFNDLINLVPLISQLRIEVLEAR